MKRIVLLAVLVFMLFAASVTAAPVADPLILNVGNWYRANPMPAAPGITGEILFQSPRSAVIIRQAPAGTKIAPHYHNTADEFLYIVEGSAELLTNGDWVKLQPGDVHANPRGAVHALNITDPKGCRFLSIFTPPQPPKGDMTFIPAGEPLQSPGGLIDASPGTGMVITLKEWESSPGVQQDQSYGLGVTPDSIDNSGLRALTAIQSPRSVLMLQDAGYGARHRHNDDQGDEIAIVVSGSAHVLTGNRADTIAKNYLQVIPMGTEHEMKLMLGESIRFISVYALPEKQTGAIPGLFPVFK